MSLFSSVLGFYLAGMDLAGLGVKLDDERVELPDESPDRQAAHLLWLQLKLRIETKPDVEYWQQVHDDLELARGRHVDAIAEDLRAMYQRIGGLAYKATDIFSHLESLGEGTVVYTNPPTILALLYRLERQQAVVEAAKKLVPLYPVEGSDGGELLAALSRLDKGGEADDA